MAQGPLNKEMLPSHHLHLHVASLIILHSLLIVLGPEKRSRLICCSVTKSCPALCDSMDCSMPGFPVLHCLLEFVQIHVHGVSDAIQPTSTSAIPFSFCLQSFRTSRSFPVSWLFVSGGQSIGASALASVLPMNI